VGKKYKAKKYDTQLINNKHCYVRYLISSVINNHLNEPILLEIVLRNENIKVVPSHLRNLRHELDQFRCQRLSIDTSSIETINYPALVEMGSTDGSRLKQEAA